MGTSTVHTKGATEKVLVWEGSLTTWGMWEQVCSGSGEGGAKETTPLKVATLALWTDPTATWTASLHTPPRTDFACSAPATPKFREEPICRARGPATKTPLQFWQGVRWPGQEAHQEPSGQQAPQKFFKQQFYRVALSAFAYTVKGQIQDKRAPYPLWQ